MKRFFKQSVIAAIYLVVFCLVVWVIFNAVYTPTCTDGLKNQGEEKTDCGGPCLSCDLRKLSAPIIAKKVYFLDTAGNTIDVGFQVKNPNLDWGANNLEYRIDFIDSNGLVIPGSVYGSTFLLPGDSKWVMEIAKFLPAQLSRLEILISTSSATWGKFRSYAKEANFVVKDTVFRRLAPPQTGYAETIGTLTNKSGFGVNSIELQAVAYEASGIVLGVTKTTIFDLKIGERREFRLFWPRPFAKEMKTYEVLVNVNLMDNETFLQKYSE